MDHKAPASVKEGSRIYQVSCSATQNLLRHDAVREKDSRQRGADGEDNGIHNAEANVPGRRQGGEDAVADPP